MRSLFRAVLVVSCAAAFACSPTLPPPAVNATPVEATKTPESNLLLVPVSDARGLLGRAVHVTPDGGWTIADELAPGCEVQVREEASTFHTSRQVDMHSMTSLSGGYATFVSIEAQFGKQNTADIDIQNTKILHGVTRGACGEETVDTVFVGHGRRDIVASAVAEAHAHVNVQLVTANPGVDTGSKIVDHKDWSDDQAYGFTYSRTAKDEPLEISADLPSFLNEGAKLTITFTSKRPAYLVVYYVSGGKGQVLWPSNEEPEPYVAPDHPAYLPSAREQAAGIKIVPTLAKAGEISREMLVVYGFADKGDYDQYKPGPDDEGDDGSVFAAALTKRLDQLPISRWSRLPLAYEICPKGNTGCGG